MRLWRLGALATGLALAGGVSAAPAANTDAVAIQMVERYLAAWDRVDPQAIGAEFAPGGDFINPTGFYARGPAQVAAFYRRAFARGYAGSVARFRLEAARKIAPGVIAVDGVWSIDAARDPGHAARPAERGLATIVLVRRAQGWRIALLREQSSAQDLEIPAR